jgi:hypothetical protein
VAASLFEGDWIFILLHCSLPGFAEGVLVSFARDSDNAADRRSFVCLHLKLLRFFLHSHPPQFADEMKGLNGWMLKVCDGDFSPVQTDAHGISLLQGQFASILAVLAGVIFSR